MADINASLKEALNGKAPQHKKKGQSTFEFSEGSDGALHTKVTDENGIPIDPRRVELPSDYPDSAVKAELEQIKQQQANIQSEVQSLKEHTFDTKLTGSNVVHFDLQESTGTVPAGTWKVIRTPDDGSTGFRVITAHGEFIKASFFLRRSVGKFEGLEIVWGGVDSVSRHPRSSIEMTGEDGVLVVSEKIDLITNDFSIRLKAADDEDLEMRNFRIYLWKR